MKRVLYLGFVPEIDLSSVTVLSCRDDVRRVLSLLGTGCSSQIVMNILGLRYDDGALLLKFFEEYLGDIVCIAPIDVCSTILSRFSDVRYRSVDSVELQSILYLRIRNEVPAMQKRLASLFCLAGFGDNFD